MKKIIMTSIAIIVAAVAAQAQSPRVESAIMRDCLTGAFSTPSTNKTTATSTSIQNVVERAVAKAKSIVNGQSNQATQTAPKPSPKKEDSAKGTTATPKKTCKCGKSCCQSKKGASTAKKSDLAEKITYPSSLPDKW